jgi:glycosyltransferase involved in cell wall biosynthesis
MRTITLSANTSWYLYNFRASTIRRLLHEGYRVLCLSPEDAYSRKLVQDLHCEWLPLRMDNQGTNPLQDAVLVLRLWRYYRQFSPVAALHFTVKNNVYGTWAAYALRVPAINNISGLGTAFIHTGLVPAIVRMLYKTSQRFAHRVFCQNEEDYAQLLAEKLVAATHLELLPGSGVDLERFHPALKKVPTRPFRFLYAGRMLADKGLYELVEAFRSIIQDGVECSLWLSGFADVENVSSIAQQQLSQWGEEAGIEWLGASDAMETVYADVDCVVLPSYREGMPRSLLEAGAMGLPVVATDVPGCRNIIQHGFNGLLCASRSSASLKQAMLQMLAMPAGERAALGDNGRRRVEEKFSDAVVVQATLRAIQSAIMQGEN